MQSLETKYAKYEEAFAQSAELVPQLNQKLLELEEMIYSPEACTEGIGVSCMRAGAHASLRASSPRHLSGLGLTWLRAGLPRLNGRLSTRLASSPSSPRDLTCDL